MRERPVVLLAYFLSGACGLVYEVVWTRFLSLTFGITVFATSTVLAAFMAGLGLGAALVARIVDRTRNPVRVYALLELGIGLYALAVPVLFTALTPAYVAAANRLEGHFLLFNLVRVALAFTVLLVPTTLMGGTVPAIGRYLLAQPGRAGWDAGLLYGLNTVGAVVGCLGAGFVLIGSLGLSRTVFVTAAINIVIGLGLLLGRVGETAPREERAPEGARGAVPRSGMSAVAWIFAGSGFCALAYEVVWTRVMVIHVHNTAYAFCMMLAVFLIGLVLGDALAMRLADRVRRPLLWLGSVEVLIGLSVVAAAGAYVGLHHLGPPSSASWSGTVLRLMARTAVVLMPGAVLFGATFPLVARAACTNPETVGSDLGRVYAANTAGGVLGSLAGAFALIPLLGLRGALVALAAVNVLLGASCWIAAAGGRERGRLLAVAIVAAVLPVLVVPGTIFSDALEIGSFHLVYYREGVTDTTGVWESAAGARVVTYGDLRGTAGTGSDLLNRVQGHLAHLLHPHPERSLQICFGVGNTLAAAALHPEVKQLDCVELSPHVRETARYFWTNHAVLDDPKVHLIVDDGRNFLLRTPERYDVITLEPPDIYTAGVVNLYTEEFYRLGARVLADDGLFCQWLPIGEMTELDMRMLVRAFQNVFPYTTMWREGFGLGPPLLLVGSRHPLQIDRDALARRMAGAAVHADLERIGIGDPEHLFRLFIAGADGTRRWVGDAPPVTDDRTMVDFTTPRLQNSGFGFGYLSPRGPQVEAMRKIVWSIGPLYARLSEPIDPLLVTRDGAP